MLSDLDLELGLIKNVEIQVVKNMMMMDYDSTFRY